MAVTLVLGFAGRVRVVLAGSVFAVLLPFGWRIRASLEAGTTLCGVFQVCHFSVPVECE